RSHRALWPLDYTLHTTTCSSSVSPATPFFLPFFFQSSGDTPHLHSFPTRRSSDLTTPAVPTASLASPQSSMTSLSASMTFSCRTSRLSWCSHSSSCCSCSAPSGYL